MVVKNPPAIQTGAWYTYTSWSLARTWSWSWLTSFLERKDFQYTLLPFSSLRNHVDASLWSYGYTSIKTRPSFARPISITTLSVFTIVRSSSLVTTIFIHLLSLVNKLLMCFRGLFHPILNYNIGFLSQCLRTYFVKLTRRSPQRNLVKSLFLSFTPTTLKSRS